MGVDGSSTLVTDAALSGMTAGGSIRLYVGGSLTIGSMNGSSIDVGAGGDISIGTMTAGGTVLMTAGDSILGGGGTNVTAGSASFNAGGSIGVRGSSPLYLSVGSVAAMAAGGDIHLVNAGTVTVANVGGVNGMSATGSITLESSFGNIVVNAPFDTHGDGEALLRFPSGALIENGDYFAQAGTYRQIRPGQVRFLWISNPYFFYPRSNTVFEVDEGVGAAGNQGENLTTILTEVFQTPANNLSAFEEVESSNAFVRMEKENVVFRWSAVAGAESYLLVIERESKTFITLWLESTAWQSLSGFSSGNYMWTVFAWTPEGLQVAYGPMEIRIWFP